MKRLFAITVLASCSSLGAAFSAENPKPDKPNVLFLSVDDMRDYVGFLKGYKGVVHTPNIDRLAAMGVAFTNAHTSATVCGPSRTSMLTGRRTSSTGFYSNDGFWKAVMPDVVSMPQHFRMNGYHTAGAGKVFHHTPGNNPPVSWDHYQEQVFDDPWVFAKWSPERYFLEYGYRGPITPLPDWKQLNGISKLGPEMDWGPIPGKREVDYGDVRVVDYAREFLRKKHGKPFFLALGTYRPHIPWHVPQKYLDMYPLDRIVLPEIKEDDLDDVPEAGRKLALTGNDYNLIKNAGKHREAVQAYLASITFADVQIGAILDLLEKSAYRNNTIIVFWSDHGWHLGTKQHWHKQTLWEETTRIPFIMKVPGVTRTNSTCDRPVDMVNVFPTLIRLCGLPALNGLDGHDMTGLLQKTDADWPYPAISEIQNGNAAVRSQDWRYIRYHDGSEELYDRRADPNEWYNLSGDKSYAKVMEDHRKWAPKFAPALPGKSAFYFDPYAYTYMDRKTGAFIDGKK